ncbi:TPA: hypothetical protein ACJIKS_005214, partial [Klebsiella quasipneumoniae]
QQVTLLKKIAQLPISHLNTIPNKHIGATNMEYAEALISFALWGILISNTTHPLKIKYKQWRRNV